MRPEYGVTFDDLLSIVNDAGWAIRYLDPTYKVVDVPRYGTTVIIPNL